MEEGSVQYLRQNEVHRVLETLTRQLLVSKPAEPLAFLAQRLKKLQHAAITDIRAREIISASGIPTIEVEVENGNGLYGASVPCVNPADPVQRHYAHSLVDFNDYSRYLGAGLIGAVSTLNTTIGPELLNKMPTDQKGLDELVGKLDGTRRREIVGANTMAALSIALARAGADIEGLPLHAHIAQLCARPLPPATPTTFFTMISGGRWCGNALGPRGYFLIPLAPTFQQCVRIAVETYHALDAMLRKRCGGAVNVAQDGGLAAPLQWSSEPFDLILRAADVVGHRGAIRIGVDVGAGDMCQHKGSVGSGFVYDMGYKSPATAGKDELTSDQLGEIYRDWMQRYPIAALIDPFSSDDWHAWTRLTDYAAPRNVLVVAGDSVDGSLDRTKKAVELRSGNALRINLTHIGSLTNTIELAKFCTQNAWPVVIGVGPEGETEDAWSADLVVGLGSGLFQCGGPTRGENVAKINQLIRIEEHLGDRESKIHRHGYKPWM